MPDPLIRWLFARRAPHVKWELETMRSLLALMGEPQRRLVPVLVGGTNGKGSVSAMLHSIAGAAGLRAGMFTSPHLVRPEERIRLGDEDIDAEGFRARVGAMKRLVEEGLAAGRLPRLPSFFEMIAAIAMAAIADARCDLAVLEVGLGGRLDATNAADPILSVVTNVGLEHTGTLGDTTAKIAAEKAGILRAGTPLVTGVTDEAALAVVAGRSRDLGAPFHHVPSTCRLAPAEDGTFDLVTPERRYASLSLSLAGRHQLGNAAVAVRAAEVLATSRGLPIGEEAVRAGLLRARWPGRLERIPGTPAVLLDGAHNPDGCRVLAAHLDATRAALAPEGRRVLVFAAMADKDAGAMLDRLAPRADGIVVTRVAIERSADPERLLDLARSRHPSARSAPGTQEALALARDEAGARGEIVVAGSLFLVGEARALLLGLEGPGNPPHEPLPPAA